MIGAGVSEEELFGAATRSQGIFTRDMDTGEPIFYADVRNAEAKYGAPFLAFHRADLLDLLAKGIKGSRMHLGHRLTQIEEDGSGIALRFANGSTHRADVVIGADGVHSTVRRIRQTRNLPRLRLRLPTRFA